VSAFHAAASLPIVTLVDKSANLHRKPVDKIAKLRISTISRVVIPPNEKAGAEAPVSQSRQEKAGIMQSALAVALVLRRVRVLARLRLRRGRRGGVGWRGGGHGKLRGVVARSCPRRAVAVIGAR
jgi:hypothetical protein